MRHCTPWRRSAAFLMVVVLTAAGVVLVTRVLFAEQEPPGPVALYASPISLPDLQTRDDVERARNQRRLRVVVSDGSCGGAARTPEQRFDRIGVRESSRTVTAWARMREEEIDGACAGVGLEFDVTWVLAEPVGARALILASRANDIGRIVIPPRSRTDVRELVLTGRGTHGQPHQMYVGIACKLAARHLRDVPRREWCAS
jgi:hypothetical protein